MSIDVEFHGMEEFIQKLDVIANQYSDIAEKHLKKCGNKMKKTAKDKTPSTKVEHPKKLKKSWTGKVTGNSGSELEYQLRNKAPHHHLVENGHVQKTPGGRVTGFTQGRHYTQTAINEFKLSGFTQQEFEKMMHEIKSKIDG